MATGAYVGGTPRVRYPPSHIENANIYEAPRERNPVFRNTQLVTVHRRKTLFLVHAQDMHTGDENVETRLQG